MERRRQNLITLYCTRAIGLTGLTVLGLIYLPIGWKILLGVIFLGLEWNCFRRNRKLRKCAEDTMKGAITEEKVADILQELTAQGWLIQADIKAEFWGDIDFHLVAPTGNHFIIDVKTEEGTIIYDEDAKELKKHYGDEIKSLAGYHGALRTVRGQGAEMSLIANVDFVTPILCFTRANIHDTVFHQKITLNGINGTSGNPIYATNTRSVISLLLSLSEEDTSDNTDTKT